MKITKAIIPAAGKGLRMQPISHVTHKELFNILNKAAIDYLLEEIENTDIEEVYLIICKSKESIKDYILSNKHLLDRFKFIFVYQEHQLGLGDAILQVKDFIKENEYFLILLPDNLITTNDNSSLSNSMIQFHYKNKCSVISVELVNPTEIHLRGALKFKPSNESNILNVEFISEKSSINPPSLYTIAGRYILSSSIFNYINYNIIQGCEIELTTAINEYLRLNKLQGYIFNGNRFDIGSIEGYAKAFTAFCIKNKFINKDYINWLNLFLKSSYIEN